MNKTLLQYHLNKVGLTYENASSILGITRCTFSRKCNGIVDFRASEIKELREVLSLTDEEVVQIFLD